MQSSNKGTFYGNEMRPTDWVSKCAVKRTFSRTRLSPTMHFVDITNARRRHLFDLVNMHPERLERIRQNVPRNRRKAVFKKN